MLRRNPGVMSEALTTRRGPLLTYMDAHIGYVEAMGVTRPKHPAVSDLMHYPTDGSEIL